jgi:hypothetical protein
VDWVVIAGLPPIGFVLEAYFTWLFRLPESVFFHGIRPGVMVGWALCVVGLALFMVVEATDGRIRNALDRALVRGFVSGLGLGLTLGSLALGIVLIPMTVFTLLVGIGLFGFVPFFVATLLSLRAGELALRGPAWNQPHGVSRLFALGLGATVAWGVPVAAAIRWGY